MNPRLSPYLRSAYRRSDLGPAGNLAESGWATNVLKSESKSKPLLRISITFSRAKSYELTSTNPHTISHQTSAY